MKLLRFALVFAGLLLTGLLAQQTPSPVPLHHTTQEALERLATVIAEKRQQLATLLPGDPAAKALTDEVQQLRQQFAGLASRLDIQEFETPQHRQLDLQHEIEQLVRPLLQFLNEATAEPRKEADLKGRIALLEQRLGTANAASAAVVRTRDALPPASAGRAECERELRERWQTMTRGMRDELLVLQANLARQTEGSGSLLSNITAQAQKFVRNSGLSLLLAALTFCAVFFTLRFFVNALLRSRRERTFSLRLIEFLLRVGLVLVAVAAAMVVPWARADWLLLALGIVFLLGAGWVVMRTLPQFLEQIRLLLNVGGVREGERVLIDGLPFCIKQLRLYTRLENPDLQGGDLRVPLQFLVGKRSRKSAADEPWFPCRCGDVVLLADGTSGPVRLQTTEVVVVEHYGAPRSYPTPQFLAQAPRNLTHGFTLDATFALHRDHFREITGACTERLQQAVAAELSPLVPGAMRGVRVQFQGVRGNGLELLALADFAGAAAGQYFELQRSMHAAFARACNQNGWQLPSVLPTTTPT